MRHRPASDACRTAGRATRLSTGVLILLSCCASVARADPAVGIPSGYPACVLTRSEGICGGMLAEACLVNATSITETSVCRIRLADALEADITVRIARAPVGDRARALELARAAQARVDAMCSGYAERVPSADTPHHHARCALLAAHLRYVQITRLLARPAEL